MASPPMTKGWFYKDGSVKTIAFKNNNIRFFVIDDLEALIFKD